MSALAVGDSIVGRWPQPDLERALGLATLKFAVGGDRLENTTYIVNQFDDAAAKNVKVVLSTTGAANVLAFEPCEFEAEARALLSSLRTKFPQAKIYVVNIYQKGVRGQARISEVTSANQILEKLASEFRLVYVDAHEAIARVCMGTENCPLLEANRVHPNAAGFEALSMAVERASGRN